MELTQDQLDVIRDCYVRGYEMHDLSNHVDIAPDQASELLAFWDALEAGEA